VVFLSFAPGPLPFLVYFHDIVSIEFSIFIFVGDSILTCSSKSPNALRNILPNDLSQLELWSDLPSITFNAAKTPVFTAATNPPLHSTLCSRKKFPKNIWNLSLDSL